MPTLRGTVSIDSKNSLREIREIRREMDQLARVPTVIKARLDEPETAKQITKLRQDLRSLSKFGAEQKISLLAKLDDQAATEGLAKLRDLLREVGRNPRVTIHVDEKQAKEAAGSVAGAVKGVSRETAASRAAFRGLVAESGRSLKAAQEQQNAAWRGAVASSGRMLGEALDQQKKAFQGAVAESGRMLKAAERDREELLKGFGQAVKETDRMLGQTEASVKRLQATGVKRTRLQFSIEGEQDIERLRAEIRRTQLAAGVMEAHLDTKEAQAKIDHLLKGLEHVQDAARITMSIDEKGDVRSFGVQNTGETFRRRDAWKRRQAQLAEWRSQREAGRQAADQLGDRAGNAANMAGLAIAGGLGASLKLATDFDRAMRNVNSIAQLSEQEFGKLGDQVLRLSRDPSIRKGPRDLAAGLLDIYSVGKEGAEALDILRDSAKGAAAGGTETAVAVDALTGTLNAGIRGAQNSRQVIDSLFQTVNDGKVSFPQLGAAIGATLPYLKAGGVSLQEYGAYMAAATLQSQEASFATNNLNNLINKMAAPPAAAAKSFEALGIKYGFAELKSKGFTAKLQEIIEKTGGSSDKLRALFPDMQAFTAAQTLAGDKMATFNRMAANQARAMDGVGATARAAAKQNVGLANDTDQAAKAMEELGIQVGRAAAPFQRELLTAARDCFTAFNKLDDGTKSFTVRLGLGTAAGLLLVGRLKDLVETVILVRRAYIGLQAQMALTEAAGVAGTGRVGVALVALRGQIGALRAFGVAGFGALGIAIGSVVAIVWGARTAFYGTRDAGTMSAERLKETWGVLGTVWDKGADKLNTIANWLEKIGRNPLIDKLLYVTPGAKFLQNTFSTSGSAADSAADRTLYQAYVNDQRKAGKKPKSFEKWRGDPNSSEYDGSHAGGLKRVPFDGYRAVLHRGERVLTAAEAQAYEDRIENLEGLIDDRVLQRSRSGNRRADPQLTEWRIELRRAKRELAEAKREAAEYKRSIREVRPFRVPDVSIRSIVPNASIRDMMDEPSAAVKAALAHIAKEGLNLPADRRRASNTWRAVDFVNSQAFVRDLDKAAIPRTEMEGIKRRIIAENLVRDEQLEAQRQAREALKLRNAAIKAEVDSINKSVELRLSINQALDRERANADRQDAEFAFIQKFGSGRALQQFRDLENEKDRLWNSSDSPVFLMRKAGQAEGAGQLYVQMVREFVERQTRRNEWEDDQTRDQQTLELWSNFKETLKDMPSLVDQARSATETINEALEDKDASFSKLLKVLKGLPDAFRQVANRGGLGKIAKDREADLASITDPAALEQARGTVGVYQSADAAWGALLKGLTKTQDQEGITASGLPKLVADADAEIKRLRGEIEGLGKKEVDVLALAGEKAAAALKAGNEALEKARDTVGMSEDGIAGAQAELEKLRANWEEIKKLTNELKDAKKKGSDEKADEAIRTEDAERLKKFKESYRDMFKTALDQTYEQGFEGFFGKVLDGTDKMLRDMALKIVANQAILGLMRLIPGFGEFMSDASKLASKDVFKVEDKTKPAGAHALGLDYVPRDGYMAQLHRGEMVLTARDAAQLRASDHYRDSFRASVPGGNGGGSVIYQNTYVHNGNVVTNDPADYQRQVRAQGKSRGGPTLARSEMARRAAMAAVEGQRRF